MFRFITIFNSFIIRFIRISGSSQTGSVWKANGLKYAFDGYKIVQFSDLHAGSLIGQQSEFKKAMEMINEQNADIIVFTGDMVNDVAEELDAKVGKYSILGNHDYGNYNWWENDKEKAANFKKLQQYHVNTVLGYIDFPGRIGADPEITVFELRVKN